MAPSIRTIEERFWEKIHKTDYCWIWTSSRDSRTGHGRIWCNKIKRLTSAHRLSWKIHNKQEIPDGKFICHHCDNPSCVNPEHLYVGDSFTNMQDAVKRKRHKESKKKKCINGHEFTKENTYLWNNERHCIVCRHQAQLRRKLKYIKKSNRKSPTKRILTNGT